ncbi:uncharacterized protein LOC118363327 isoform X2 [Oncorhynchus keta]|uniref:uncharacterized protein LOC118363327 isoform X2 n=1 Tax=Oncorhynchus keta TaxID=8018 RepID=UPI00227B063B|nr:uncharacterized protein LOC118363327 isoform X2 [Oncorhynchus keta]
MLNCSQVKTLVRMTSTQMSFPEMFSDSLCRNDLFVQTHSFISCLGGWSQTIPQVKKPNVEVQGWRGYTRSAVARPVGRPDTISKTKLEAAYVWLLTGCAWYCERLGELGPAASTEASHRACQERLRDLVNRTKNRALVHIACLENQASWTNVEQAFLKVTEGLNSLTNQTLRGKLEVCISLYSYDSVGTVRPPASLIVPLGPCLHHAGRNHEPDGGDSATDGTADDDQEGADSGCRPLPCLQRACWLCRDTCCLEKAWTPSWLHIAATGKLTSFARMFIKLNEFLKHFSGEGFVLGASPAVRHILLHAVSRVADLRIRSWSHT